MRRSGTLSGWGMETGVVRETDPEERRVEVNSQNGSEVLWKGPFPK